jgi:hypothetical protein
MCLEINEGREQQCFQLFVPLDSSVPGSQRSEDLMVLIPCSAHAMYPLSALVSVRCKV